MPEGMKRLKTVDDVIAALGGTTNTAKVLGRSAQSVSNMRIAGRMPSATFLRALRALRKAGYDAPPELWGIENTGGEAA